MRRAIELANLGLGSVSPNPVVGCVIVCDDKVIGEGYHKAYGEDHAEVNAINSVSDKELLGRSTVYVTLEPCAHFGKTPPCADLLIEKGCRRVVIGMKDPFEKVNGNGIDKLKAAGIEIETDVLHAECRASNIRFVTFHERTRPYVILKWAQTSDGFIARENFDSKWISNNYSRQLVHQWRGVEDAILVGKNTARYDNPNLTTRESSGKNPVRIVIDHKLELSDDLHVFNGEVRTFRFNEIKEESTKEVEFVRFDGSMSHLMTRLHEKGIQSLIVEGGTKTLESFITSETWDEARVFTADKEFEKGIAAPNIGGILLSDNYDTGDRLEIYKNVH